ncbi:hypothetical protein A2115_01145 [Candidatus Woesebacteria bacterium GWA1_41_8]|uniref:Nudix hydrolase domain-containing protein n=1 Tax=Candidatus Woesebacteria bacterium GWA1_41_8 TaxID=1802471 RepID=A0A1F7WIE3_9BACT|nr:MAG: hypothetical protein A2115_01145 [Candidatus Woesebacteria bacterium GWA1_41_8]
MSSENQKETRKRFTQSISSAVFIEDVEGKLLLLKQNKQKGGKWGPPSGGVEYGEDPAATAEREANEEANLQVELVSLIGIYPVKRGENYYSGIGFVYRARLKDQTNIKIDGEEIVDARYFKKEEVKKLIQDNQIYKPEYNESCIADWLDGKNYQLDVVKPIIDAEKLY